jgi:hypothetical protein
VNRDRLALLEKEREQVSDEIDALYWAFTRQARAQPPVLTRPDLYERRAALEIEIKALKRARKGNS